MGIRALIAIGCNQYDDARVGNLSVAEKDAQSIFASLIDERYGRYDEDFSTLLISPNLDEIRTVVRETFNNDNIDVVTFFFAGHGAIDAGTYYLCPRDTLIGKLHLSGYSLSELVRIIGGSQVGHAHVIIDACQSAGAIFDLSSLFAGDTLGNATSTNVSIFSACAIGEEAYEDSTGGVATKEILKCVNGDTVISDTYDTLGLVDIGRKISPILENLGQHSSMWGLNLVDFDDFCLNPNVSPREGILRSDLHSAASEEVKAAIAEYLPIFWKEYLLLGETIDPRSLQNSISSILDQINNNEQRLLFVQRIFFALQQRVSASEDPFEKVTVGSVCFICLLPYISSIEDHSQFKALLAHFSDTLREVLSEMLSDLKSDDLALVSPSSMGRDYFFLPLKISQILAWSEIMLLLNKGDDAYKIYIGLVDKIFESYANSIEAMSDAQSASVKIVADSLARNGLSEKLEEFLGRMLSSYISNEGLVADPYLTGAEEFAYLFKRKNTDNPIDPRVVSTPSELGVVLFYSADIASATDILDGQLKHLDRLHLSTFLADSPVEFGDYRIENGMNLEFQIGFDVFTYEDFSEAWSKLEKPKVKGETYLTILKICSLIYPDRVCWFEEDPVYNKTTVKPTH